MCGINNNSLFLLEKEIISQFDGSGIELEEKNIGEELRAELLLGNICFLCMTIKFGLINWAYDCKICQKKVVSHS